MKTIHETNRREILRAKHTTVQIDLPCILVVNDKRINLHNGMEFHILNRFNNLCCLIYRECNIQFKSP
jgi:hypothetical protein